MVNKIYKTILDRKLDTFVGLFVEDSTKIFKGLSEKIIHSGEYGRYREDSCKDLLQFLLNPNCSISDGFIITADDEISTQCDIIIHNSNVPPLLVNGIAKMFPIEEVRAIGEIKSNLNKKNFNEALIKLSKNKALYKKRMGVAKKKPSNSGCENNCFNSIGSFLICKKLDFDYTQIDFKEIYKDIPRKEWHNAILSIDDGCLIYSLNFNNCSTETIQKLEAANYRIEKKPIWPYPFFGLGEFVETRCIYIGADSTDKYQHILKFFEAVVSLVKDLWTYEHDPIIYLGLNGSFFDE